MNITKRIIARLDAKHDKLIKGINLEGWRIIGDLKKYAYFQLLNENIPNSNIDISNLCTYESIHDFHSWRRTKTNSRQWNFIST